MSGARGSLVVVGLGPGGDDRTTPEAREALAAATDLVGYGPYLARIEAPADVVRHASDNGAEARRAQTALALAAAGRRVVVVSSGDAGVFGMAGAVVEALDAEPAWRDVDLRIAPGVTALLAAAAKLGAPLGQAFAALNLSDNLKPWSAVEKRLRAAADGEFVLALYNPRSAARPTQLDDAFDVLRRELPPDVPTAFAHAVGTPQERIEVTTLGEARGAAADMRTLVIVGTRRTRLAPRGTGHPFLYTPRSEAE